MIELESLLPILLYISLIVLVITVIIFVIRLIKTLDKVDIILDDVNSKMIRVDGLFSLIDRTADYAATLSDKVISLATNGINFLFKRKKGRDDDE